MIVVIASSSLGWIMMVLDSWIYFIVIVMYRKIVFSRITNVEYLFRLLKISCSVVIGRILLVVGRYIYASIWSFVCFTTPTILNISPSSLISLPQGFSRTEQFFGRLFCLSYIPYGILWRLYHWRCICNHLLRYHFLYWDDIPPTRWVPFTAPVVTSFHHPHWWAR